MPEAEIDVTEELVIGLIRQQHPDLLAPLQLVANGWDNVIFRLGDSLSVRLPRRELAAELITKEQRWLPELAPRLPVPIPVAVRVGVPTDDYPWSWSIGPWFDGHALTEVPVPGRTAYAAEVAEFFAALHRPAPADAPRNPVRGIPLAERGRLVAEHLDLLAAPQWTRDLWDELAASPELTRPPCWLHGDPHPANVLVDDRRLAAMIDFGDLCAGDPATDLAVAWLAFTDQGRRQFRDHYTALAGDDPDLWRRARGWALSLALSLLANSDDNPGLAAVGRLGLDQVKSDR
jgi:aminoglycoside phosphotransferase (APT) family kinase protein